MKPAILRTRLALAAVAAAGIALAALASCESDARRPPTSPPPPGQTDLTLAPVGGTFATPVFLTAPPGDTARLFVAEKGGTIRVVKGGTKLATPFLDLSASVSKGPEQGLLGLAFPPDYSTSGIFYVSYTDAGDDSRLARYRVSTADPDVADASSGEIFLTVAQPFTNHNGGMICFGPDGRLYFGLGDGGNANDPSGTGQGRGDLLGSILRLDVSAAPGYAIPPDNPYAGSTGMRPELWDYGLRNPWRFSFDRLTGDLWIGDVGQDEWEEIDVSTAAGGGGRGVNYGWRITEGTHCFPPGSNCVTTGLRLPVHEYPHTDGNCVIGGYVYRGKRVPALQGHYFYADNGFGWMRSFRLSGGVATEHASWPLPSGSGGPLSFGEDADGDLYLLTSTGKVYRFQP